jgi:hypothetical protein
MKNIRTAILAVCIGTLGSLALQAQYQNTFDGYNALASDTTGDANSAFGFQVLCQNTTGYNNTASGSMALNDNITGYQNTASGVLALGENTTGHDNTASGMLALLVNQTGSLNTATGSSSLVVNFNGGNNTASGASSLASNTSGGYNTAFGSYALDTNISGSDNIGIGYKAGNDSPNGASNNIDIGSQGSSNDYNGVVRIGTAGSQQSFFVAGVFGVASSLNNTVDVMIDSNGQLVTKNSSIRFKEEVHDMAAASDGLMRLRPVTYRYKQPYADGSKPIDYGLIAEEVAEVYPDLVVKNAAGQIQTVQYQKLIPMLLNEAQKQQRTIEEMEKRLAALEESQQE